LAPDVEFGLWRQLCDWVSTSLEVFTLNLLSNIKRFRGLGDKEGADVISSSCIACLAHLAILYEAVCQIDPVSESKSYTLYDLALQRLGMLTSELLLNKYTHLDLLLGVCPSLSCFPVVVAQTFAGIGLLAQIVTCL
jgi:hypothetical protein